MNYTMNSQSQAKKHQTSYSMLCIDTELILSLLSPSIFRIITLPQLCYLLSTPQLLRYSSIYVVHILCDQAYSILSILGHSIPNQYKNPYPSIFMKFGTDMDPIKKLPHTKI